MRRLNHRNRSGITSLLSLLFFATASTGLGSTVFSNTNSISIPATTGGASLPVTSNPYPSQIAVDGMVGTLTNISVTLNGLTDNGAFPNLQDLFFLLAGPGGQAFDFLGDVRTSPGGLTDLTLTLADGGAGLNGVQLVTSGTFEPTVLGTSCPAFPSPAPTAIKCAPLQGTSTFANAFAGSAPNGAWSLYSFDNTAGDTASTISRGWSVAIDSTGGFVPPPPPAPEPSSLILVGLATGLFALCRRQKRS